MMRTAEEPRLIPPVLSSNMSNAYSPGHEVRLPYKYTARLDADALALGYVLFVSYPLPVLEKWIKLRTCCPPWPRARLMIRW